MKYTKSRSSLFLMELIIVILFFTIATAICLQIFVKSRNLSRETSDINSAITICVSAAEIISNATSNDKDPYTAVLNAYGNKAENNTEDEISIGFNNNMSSFGVDDPEYILDISKADSPSENIAKYQITMTHDSDDILYSLELEVIQ